MPDKITDVERRAIEAFLERAKRDGIEIKCPTGKSVIDLSQPINYKKHGQSMSMIKRRERGEKTRKAMAKLLAQGLTYHQVAEKMGISYSTVLHHVRKIKFPNE